MFSLIRLTAPLAVVVCVMTAPVAARGASGDPAADSPAGTIYQLPLDGARMDAAPRPAAPAGTTPALAETPTEARTALRSENGFGSSSTVPGTRPARDTVNDGAIRSGGTDARGAATRPTKYTGGTRAPDLVAPAAATTSVATDDPSNLGVYALLAFVLVAGVAAGLMTRSRRRSLAAP